MPKPKKPRSYSDYTLDDLQTICGIDNRKSPLNLAGGPPLEPSDWLKQHLTMSKMIPLNTEKAKSEYLIAPVLLELKSKLSNRFTYFSGNNFDVDPSKALKGRCDFLLTKALSMNITAPVIAIFEAKDDNLDRWLGQCGAEMVAARLFNQQKEAPIEIIHGAVSNGYQWLFLRLEDDLLWVDTERYGLENLPRLLGVLQAMIEFYHDTEFGEA